MRTEGKSHAFQCGILQPRCVLVQHAAYRIQDANLKWDVVCGGQHKYLCTKKSRGEEMMSEWLMLTETMLRCRMTSFK